MPGSAAKRSLQQSLHTVLRKFEKPKSVATSTATSSTPANPSSSVTSTTTTTRTTAVPLATTPLNLTTPDARHVPRKGKVDAETNAALSNRAMKKSASPSVVVPKKQVVHTVASDDDGSLDDATLTYSDKVDDTPAPEPPQPRHSPKSTSKIDKKKLAAPAVVHQTSPQEEEQGRCAIRDAMRTFLQEDRDLVVRPVPKSVTTDEFLRGAESAFAAEARVAGWRARWSEEDKQALREEVFSWDPFNEL